MSFKIKYYKFIAYSCQLMSVLCFGFGVIFLLNTIYEYLIDGEVIYYPEVIFNLIYIGVSIGAFFISRYFINKLKSSSNI